MPRFSLSTALLAVSAILAPFVSAQDFSTSHNVTGIAGTWSSGSGAVLTGSGFCNPSNFSFTYPATTGISYSFTDDGYFEEAQYRFNSNGSYPRCITAFVLWQHGTYQFNSNGSITLYPFAADGRIQVQDPCAAVTNIITYYDQQTLYSNWNIYLDSVTANYELQLYKFDGSLMPPLYLRANPPNMLPTQVLTGPNATGQYQGNAKRSDNLEKRSGALLTQEQAGWAAVSAAGLAMAAIMGL